ncbi:MAG: acyltransferase family protein [Rhodocyclaceae bacterium]|nr:acyltransferase family protein [Rhodocyclaceae bacterium]
MSNQATVTGKQVSDNFTQAKFLAIVLVSTGHYFDGSLLWVPVTVGLFIFAFASGYFTSLKHSPDMPLGKFWLAKIKRLGPPLIVINLFLGILFLIQGREGIWHPHTLLGMTGLTGFLNWFGIANQSPFGAGLWFMTVLLLFYLLYPLLAKLLITRGAAIAFLLSSAAICAWGHLYASPPYMLWPTVFGFCLGAIAGRLDWQPQRTRTIVLGTTAVLAMLAANAMGIKQFNVLFIVIISIASVAFLLSVPISFPANRMSILSGSILEIYLIHGYMFIKTLNHPIMGYITSMLIIILTSLLLNRTSLYFSFLFNQRRHKIIKHER